MEDREEFKCPISREIMKTPVIFWDGYTYELSYITEYIKTRREACLPITSPITGEVFSQDAYQIVHNRNLRAVMEKEGIELSSYSSEEASELMDSKSSSMSRPLVSLDLLCAAISTMSLNTLGPVKQAEIELVCDYQDTASPEGYIDTALYHVIRTRSLQSFKTIAPALFVSPYSNSSRLFDMIIMFPRSKYVAVRCCLALLKLDLKSIPIEVPVVYKCLSGMICPELCLAEDMDHFTTIEMQKFALNIYLELSEALLRVGAWWTSSPTDANPISLIDVGLTGELARMYPHLARDCCHLLAQAAGKRLIPEAFMQVVFTNLVYLASYQHEIDMVHNILDTILVMIEVSDSTFPQRVAGVFFAVWTTLLIMTNKNRWGRESSKVWYKLMKALYGFLKENRMLVPKKFIEEYLTSLSIFFVVSKEDKTMMLEISRSLEYTFMRM